MMKTPFKSPPLDPPQSENDLTQRPHRARAAFFVLYAAAVGAVWSALAMSLLDNKALGACIGLFCGVICGSVGRFLIKEREITVPLGFIAVPLFSILTPVVAAVALIVLGASLVIVLAVLLPVCKAVRFACNRRLHAKLYAQGRLLRVDELAQRLAAGEGTLVEDWGWFNDDPAMRLVALSAALPDAPGTRPSDTDVRQRMPYRLWWTADDLLAEGLPAAEEVFLSILSGEAGDWHAMLVERYLDPAAGRASLVLCRGRRIGALRRQFPGARTVLLAPSRFGKRPKLPDVEPRSDGIPM